MARGKSFDNAEILAYALKHLEKERDEIQARIDGVYRQLGRVPSTRGNSARAMTPVPVESTGSPDDIKVDGRKRRVLSEGARKRIAAAQKLRWAEHRKNQEAKIA